LLRNVSLFNLVLQPLFYTRSVRGSRVTFLVHG
jgi:hypothetical protein